MTKQELKLRIFEAIDCRRDDLNTIAQSILAHPELGFKERQTAALVSRTFDLLGIPHQDGLAVTGVKARLGGRADGPTVGVFGELDAVTCPLHPKADPETGAAHACGHCYQIAAMLGVAYGLAQSGAMGELDGHVALMAAPAEEMVELAYRRTLKDAGKIKYFSGKQEFLRTGVLDDVDMTMMVHAFPQEPDVRAFIHGGNLGNIAKTMRFIGREAHASRPFEGVNALNAATLALTAIHMQRETFRDEDSIRVHPIITKGGDLVNVVPADVRMETYVRGRTIESILAANRKVNRALLGAAYIIGAKVEIEELPGYLPLRQSRGMGTLFGDNAAALFGRESVVEGVDSVGSTDMGDISQVIPSIQPSMGGFYGTLHGADFAPADPESAILAPAKVMAATVVDLLWDGAAGARKVLATEKPAMTRKAYFKLWDDLTSSIQE